VIFIPMAFPNGVPANLADDRIAMSSVARVRHGIVPAVFRSLDRAYRKVRHAALHIAAQSIPGAIGR